MRSALKRNRDSIHEVDADKDSTDDNGGGDQVNRVTHHSLRGRRNSIFVALDLLVQAIEHITSRNRQGSYETDPIFSELWELYTRQPAKERGVS